MHRNREEIILIKKEGMSDSKSFSEKLISNVANIVSNSEFQKLECLRIENKWLQEDNEYLLQHKLKLDKELEDVQKKYNFWKTAFDIGVPSLCIITCSILLYVNAEK